MRALSLIKIPVSGGGGTTSPAGSDNDIQINEGGAFAADSGVFTYNPTGRVFSTQDFTASATSLFYTDGTDQFGVTGGALAYINASGNVFNIDSAGQVNIANNVVVGNNVDTISSGFVQPTLIHIPGTYTVNGGLLNFNGVLIDSTFDFVGGTSVVNGFAFHPTVTGTPSALNAFTNTVGSNLFNTLGGQTIIGPTGAVGSSIFQVFGNSMFSGAMTVGSTNVSAPTASIQIVKPGTAAAGDGQLKLTTDTALKTNPEEGLFEVNGGHLYFTVGGTRHTLI